MADKKFIIDIGSASKKYALFSGGEEVFHAHFEKENGGFEVAFNRGAAEPITEPDFGNATGFAIQKIIGMGLVADKNEISKIGIRIVAAGSYFVSNRVIDADYIAKLNEAKENSPIHLAPMIAEIENIAGVLPGIPVVGVSDSGFHATLPDYAKNYSLPAEDASKHDIYRFGYHGLSFQSVLRKIGKSSGSLPPRVVVCHLGSGVSVAAIKDGKSIDTSMGFTPLEGLIMSTRIGNIDAGAVIHLAKESGMDLEALEGYFNGKCGLLGLSGKSDDIRQLIELEKSGDARAKLALNSFTYNVKKYIGAYAAALGGLDLLVFTATVGERSFIMRSRICSGLEGLGIVLDQNKNNATVSVDGVISSDDSKVKITVVSTNEMTEIAEQMESVD